MSFEKNRNAQFHIISSADIVAGTFADSAAVTAAMMANAIPGVTDFGYDHEMEVVRRGKGQFGANRPVGITDVYGGVKGSFDVEGVDGEHAVLAAINRVSRAAYVNGNYNRLYDFYLLCNVTEDDGSPLNAHFCEMCKVDGVPKKITPDVKKFSFQGIFARDFAGKKIRYHIVSGNSTPVTSLPFPSEETAAAWQDENGISRYALLVLRYNGSDGTNKRIEKATASAAGFYSEDGTAVTLNTGDALETNDKALVIYLV